MKVYLIQGESGCYDDYTKWIVCAYTTEVEAGKHCELANACVLEIITARDNLFTESGKVLEDDAIVNKYDAGMRWDSWSVPEYNVLEIELYESAAKMVD